MFYGIHFTMYFYFSTLMVSRFPPSRSRQMQEELGSSWSAAYWRRRDSDYRRAVCL